MQWLELFFTSPFLFDEEANANAFPSQNKISNNHPVDERRKYPVRVLRATLIKHAAGEDLSVRLFV